MNFIDVIQTTGPNVLGPLKTGANLPDSFYAVVNGCPVLKDGKYGSESSFKTEEEALAFAKRFAKYLEEKYVLGYFKQLSRLE